jgi:hypothetical protein
MLIVPALLIIVGAVIATSQPTAKTATTPSIISND